MAKQKEIHAFMHLITDDPNRLQKYIDHHMDYIIDFESDNLISNVHCAKSYIADSVKDKDVKTHQIQSRIDILKDVLENMMEHKPSAKELTSDKKLSDIYDKAAALYFALTAE